MADKVPLKLVGDVVNLLDRYFDDPTVMKRILFNGEKEEKTLEALSDLREEYNKCLNDDDQFASGNALRSLFDIYTEISVAFRSYMCTEHLRVRQRIDEELGIYTAWKDTWHALFMEKADSDIQTGAEIAAKRDKPADIVQFAKRDKPIQNHLSE
jgi:hypothetical protein